MTTPVPTQRPPDPLDPLDYPLVFTQRRLLTPEEFLKECDLRWKGLHSGELGLAQLEALHRARVLVPFYRVAADLRLFRRLAREEGSDLEDVLRRLRTKDCLPEHRAGGTLFHPAAQSFRPWRAFRRSSELGPVWTSVFLYSPYQLLTIPTLRENQERLCAVRREGGLSNWSFRFSEPPIFVHCRKQLIAIADLIPILSILEARYLPEIPDRTSLLLSNVSTDEWNTLAHDFDPLAFLQLLGWPPDRLVEEADRLLFRAHSIDPLTAWQEVIRLASREKLSELRNDPLIAHDHRLAAELLLRLYEDLAEAGAAPPLPGFGRFWHVQMERLATDRGELDRVLTEFGLSPHPSLVLALEGETEMVIMPKVMDHLGMRRHPSFIRLFNYGGVNKSFDLLVQYIATPFLGDPRVGMSQQTVVPFERPATRFLLIADPESRFTTDDQRAKWRQTRLSEIYASLPCEYQTDSTRWQLEDLVAIDSWGAGQCFEFANFDDGDLAQALGVPQHEIAALRLEGRFNNGKLREMWGRLAQTGHPLPSAEPPTKAALAQALWPLLQARIVAAQQAGDVESIPVVRVAVHAWRIAARTRRSQVALFPEHTLPPSVTTATANTEE